MRSNIIIIWKNKKMNLKKAHCIKFVISLTIWKKLENRRMRLQPFCSLIIVGTLFTIMF